jgi:hypothetical protein
MRVPRFSFYDAVSIDYPFLTLPVANLWKFGNSVGDLGMNLVKIKKSR